MLEGDDHDHCQEIMHAGATCIQENETLRDAARRMREVDVGALPICGEDDRLNGIITDRDIVVKCLAKGKDAWTESAGWLEQDKPITVDAKVDAGEILRIMEVHKIRRVPVIDNHRLVGLISEADLARHLPENQVRQFVEVGLPDRPVGRRSAALVTEEESAAADPL
ncbi:CBS domain-containing protein [Streptomyces sp. NPDC019531]|uniref:CBS domain-containing protein n=1 Tax=Streptomyces sp. NPDC019531 TaxID=3365062 RepID=UPI00384DEB70